MVTEMLLNTAVRDDSVGLELEYVQKRARVSEWGKTREVLVSVTRLTFAWLTAIEEKSKFMISHSSWRNTMNFDRATENALLLWQMLFVFF